MSEPDPAPVPQAVELQPENQPPPVQSDQNCPPQNNVQNPLPVSEGPSDSQPTPVQTVVIQSAPINQVIYQVQTCRELPAEDKAPPVQAAISPPGPANAVPYMVQPYEGYPVQNNLSNPMCHHGAPPPAGPQAQNQPPPAQTVVNQSGPCNPAPQQVQPYAGYPVQNYLQNPMAQQAQYIAACPMGCHCGHGTTSPPAALVPNHQPSSDFNLSGASNSGHHQVQAYAGIQMQNQPPPDQTLINQCGPGNPALHQVQACAGCAPQNHLPNPLPQSEGPAPAPPHAGLQPQNPLPVQPYAAPPAPPLIIPYGVPPGLEYLTQIDQILIHQKIKCLEILTGFETNNQYEIKNSVGQEIYHAKEKSDCIIRNICGSARNFEMRIKDNMGQEVIRMQRPMRCFLQEIEIQAPPGIIVGYVKQEWSCFLPRFTIRGPNSEVQMKIHGPFLPFRCCGDVNFEVKGLIGGVSVGKIIKQRSGIIKKCLTDVSYFCIQFPLDMDVKMKAVLLGACLLIDIMYYEKGGHLFLKLLK